MDTVQCACSILSCSTAT